MNQFSHLIQSSVSRTLALAFTFTALLGNASAVVIASGDGSGNTTAPVDDPGFANVGAMGSGGAVYLGNQWILTAAHLSTSSGVATFGGTSYNFLSGTNTRLSNPAGSGLTGVIDLRMIRLDADPGLPALTIASAAPSAGDDVLLIGRGRNRSTSGTSWDVDVVPDPFVWTAAPPPADASGFTTVGSNTIRWGENEVDNPSVVVNTGLGDTQSFTTVFNSTGMTHEAQAVAGDSGGAVFSSDGVDWELIGIMHSIGTFNGQPANTAVFGNVTNSTDLSFYADEINAIVATPEPSASLLGLIGLFICLQRRRS